MALFVALWFCPWAWISPKSISGPPALLWLLFFRGLFPADGELILVAPVLMVLCFYSILFGVVALVVGWVLHCFVVIVRETWRDRRGQTA